MDGGQLGTLKWPDFCWVVDRKDGIGHTVRSTTITTELEARGAIVCPGDTELCPAHGSVIIVDSKVFPRPLTHAAKNTDTPIAIIDNLRAPSIRHNLHIFPHPYAPPSLTSTTLRAGTEYIVMHPSIATINPNTSHGRSLIISMGAADPNKFTPLILNRLRDLNYPKGVNVLFGRRHRGLNHAIAALRPGGTHFNPFHHFFFDDAHAAIVGFGLTFYEMTYLRIPAMCLTHSNPDTVFVKEMAQHLGYNNPDTIPWWGGDTSGLAPPESWQGWLADPAGRSLKLPGLDNNGAKRCAELLLGVAG